LKEAPEESAELDGDHQGSGTIDGFLFNIHEFGLNFRHFGLIVSRIRTYQMGDMEMKQWIDLQTMLAALVTEGLARTLKNLVS